MTSQIEINLKREMRNARRHVMSNLCRIPFDDAAGGRVMLSHVDLENGIAYFSDAISGEPTGMSAHEKSWSDVVNMITKAARRRNADGWEFVVAGRGEFFVYDYPGLVVSTGHTFDSLCGRGISWCISNPKTGAEAWT